MLSMSLLWQVSRLAVFALALWCRDVMRAEEPAAPWASTYDAIALAIAEAASEHPLFPGEEGPRKTAALLLGVAEFESHFDQNAIGDNGRSFGLWQIQPATAGAPVAELLDPTTGAAHAVRLFGQSMVICGAYPQADQLAWFVHGRAGCARDERSVRLSRHRWALAAKLFADYPAEDWGDED